MKDGCKNTGVSAQACGRVCFTDREKADYWIYRSCNFIELIWYSSMLQSPGLFCIMYNGSSKVLSCITYSNSTLLPDGSLSGTLFYSWCQILSLFSPFPTLNVLPLLASISHLQGLTSKFMRCSDYTCNLFAQGWQASDYMLVMCVIKLLIVPVDLHWLVYLNTARDKYGWWGKHLSIWEKTFPNIVKPLLAHF